MKKTVLIFTRTGYAALLDENKEMFEELKDKEIIYALSIRTTSKPPAGSYKELHTMEMIDNDEFIKKWLINYGIALTS